MKTWKAEELPLRNPFAKIIANVVKKKYHIGLAGLLLICSFCLSKAVLFEAVVPFFLPIIALTFVRFRDWLSWALVGGLLGSLSLGLGETIIHVVEMFTFLLLMKTSIRKWSLPITVGLCILFVQMAWQMISYSAHPPLLVMLYVGYESALSVFMTLFLSLLLLPIHQMLTTKWTLERLGAALIVVAVVLTSINGMVFNFLSVAHIVLHTLILVAAAVGGVTLSTAVAVLTGTILSLSHLSYSGMMAVYGLTGLFAGVCKKAGRLWIAIGGAMAAFFFALYDATLPLDITFFMSTFVSSLLFLLLPAKWIEYWREQLYPNRDEVLLERQRWLTERVTTKLADFNHFVIFMKELVHERFGVTAKQEVDQVVEQPLSPCHSCFQYERCWSGKKHDMEPLMRGWLAAHTTGNNALKLQFDEKIGYKCVRSGPFLTSLKELVSKQQLSDQFYHGKKMIALQLRDMSQHIDAVMNDMTNEAVSFQQKEEELSEEFKRVGIEHFQIDILSNEAGNRKIVCCLPEKKTSWETDQSVAERLILPILHNIFQEPFEIGQTYTKETPYLHLQMTFQSAIRFDMEYDVLSTAIQNTLYSGDSHAVFSLHRGLTAVMLSDGMGHSRESHQESRRLIHLMRECMHHQMSPETAMHTLHYAMSLKQDTDMYATMDFSLIDLQHGKLWSWKAGSMATYLMRGEELIRLESRSVPVGFLSSFSVEADQVPLKAGDLIFMCTDGLFFENRPWDEQEQLLLQHIREHENRPINEICGAVLEAFRGNEGPNDDCTLVAIRIQHKIVDWSLFKPSFTDISQERMVK